MASFFTPTEHYGEGLELSTRTSSEVIFEVWVAKASFFGWGYK
jgi:hypothetical protein